MSLTVVLDKSFLQGSSKAQVADLAKQYRLSVPDALLYELLTCDATIRANCFSKFPGGENPVDFIGRVGPLISYEIDNKVPCGKPSLHKEDTKFKLHPDLGSPAFVIGPTQQQYVDDEKELVRSEVYNFMDRAVVTGTMFENIVFGNNASREAIEKVIMTPSELLRFYSSLTLEGPRQLPVSDLISQDWALYRWLQVDVLAAFDIYYRYNGHIPELTDNIYERIEHDYLDTQVLMMGCLEGIFASRDNRLRRWFNLLCPSAVLIS